MILERLEEVGQGFSRGEYLFSDVFEVAKPILEKKARANVIPSYSSEDLFQELCIVLLNVCRVFDPSKGIKFTTLLYQSIENRLKYLRRWSSAVRRSGTFFADSYDRLREEEGFDIPFEHDYSDIEIKLMLRAVCTPSEYKILSLVMEGYDAKQIGRSLGKSPSSIYYSCRKLGVKLASTYRQNFCSGVL